MDRLVIFLMALFLASTGLTGQVPINSRSAKETAIKHCLALKSGLLVVRVPTADRKITTLQQLIDDPETTRKDRASWERDLAKALEERDATQADLSRAFRENYDFSTVAFIPDTAIRAILHGQAPLPVDLTTPADKLVASSDSLYILVVGHTPESSLDGLVILTAAMENIPRPFPGNVTMSGFAGLFGWLDGGGFANHVERLNKKLWKFYNTKCADYRTESRRSNE